MNSKSQIFTNEVVEEFSTCAYCGEVCEENSYHCGESHLEKFVRLSNGEIVKLDVIGERKTDNTEVVALK